MNVGLAGGSRGRVWWIGRLARGMLTVIAVLAGVVVAASAQITTNPPPAGNPTLKAECGLKVMLVLDMSASIVSPGGNLGNQTPAMRAAANGFVDALEGTGSELATASFWDRGRPGIGYQEVTDTSAPIFRAWVNGNPNGLPNIPNPFNPTSATTATNWQDGFNQVGRTPGGPPDLVVFVTDGDPNSYINTSGGVTTSTTTQGVQTALNEGVAAANRVKTAPPAGTGPSRILTIGVGPALTSTASKERLTKISGTRVFPASAATAPTAPPGVTGTDALTEADFTTVSFAGLRDELTGLVAALCGSRLIITKEVPDHTGTLTDAAGWTFRATLTPEGTHTWLHPANAIDGTRTGPTARLTTGSNGIADFQWRLHRGDTTVNVSAIKETEKEGSHFEVAQCHDLGPGGPIAGSEEVSSAGIPGGKLGREDFRECTVVNRPSMANLTVVKSLDPRGDPGRFNLHIHGVADEANVTDGQGTGPHSLPLGHYMISETAGVGTSLDDYDTSISCANIATEPPSVVVSHHRGTSVSVPLTKDGEDVVCTISNVSTKFGQITVIKRLVPANDSGRFNLLVNGTTAATAVGDGGHTPPIRLPFGTHHVTETAANGTDLGHYKVSTTCIDERTGEEVEHNAHGPAVSVALSRAVDSVQCTIQNERHAVKVARLEVVKHLVPADDAGRFDLLIGDTAFALAVRQHGSTGPLDFELGTHTVTERAAGATNLAEFAITTTCVDRAHGGHTVAHNAHGPSVSVALNSATDDIVCTITNRRTLPPTGGEVSGTAPHLAIVKAIPAQARVGELVPITIVVHNLGRGAATGVQLRETRPPGMRIVQAADGGTIQRGTAVWRLGNLAPGQSRAVRATARVVHTGLHVDTAVATALNADPALSDAAVRAAVRPRPPTPPPPVVTG